VIEVARTRTSLVEEVGDVDISDDRSVVSYISESSSLRSDRRNPAVQPPLTVEAIRAAKGFHRISLNNAFYFLGFKKIGYSRRFSYGYSPPGTHRSLYFSRFCSVFGDYLQQPSDLNLYEFRPPLEKDLLIHLTGYQKNKASPHPGVALRMRYALEVLASLEGGAGPWIEDWLRESELDGVRVPSQSSPGLRYAAYGYKTKKDALPKAVLHARRDLRKMVIDGILPDRVPCKLAGRGKLVNITAEEKAKDGRLIMVPCIVRHLLGSLASQQYTRHLKRLDRVDGGCMLGLGPTGGKWQDFGRKVKGPPGSVYMMLDFSGFDQSLPRWVLTAAFSYVQSRFSNDPGSSTYWTNEYRELVDTIFATPAGAVFQKKRGVTSGDPWTSIIGSVSNFIMLESICIKLGIEAKIWVFGDDSIIRFKSIDNFITIDRMSRELKGDFGTTVHPGKSHIARTFHSTPDCMKGANFLSLYWDGDFKPFGAAEDTWKHLMYPEINQEDDPGWELIRSISYYILSWNNPRVNRVVEMYYNYLRRYTMGPTMNFDGIRRLLQLTDLNPRDLRFDVWNHLPTPIELTNLYYHGGWRNWRPGFVEGNYDDVLLVPQPHRDDAGSSVSSR